MIVSSTSRTRYKSSRRRPRNCSEAPSTSLQQLRSAGMALMPRQFTEIQGVLLVAKNPLAQLLQRFQPLRHRHDLRVGNRVRRARQQIRQADLRPHRARQHAQRQVKRARGPLEQVRSGWGVRSMAQPALASARAW